MPKKNLFLQLIQIYRKSFVRREKFFTFDEHVNCPVYLITKNFQTSSFYLCGIVATVFKTHSNFRVSPHRLTLQNQASCFKR